MCPILLLVQIDFVHKKLSVRYIVYVDFTFCQGGHYWATLDKAAYGKRIEHDQLGLIGAMDGR